MNVVVQETICVEVNVLAKKLPDARKVLTKIREDLVTVVKHYEKENTDKIKVSLVEWSK